MNFRKVLCRLNPTRLICSFRNSLGKYQKMPISNDNYINHSLKNKIRNLVLKSKIVILLVLIVIGVGLILSEVCIFTADNYAQYVRTSHNMDIYLKIDKIFQDYDGFYNDKFRVPKHQFGTSKNKNLTLNEFNHNYSSTALISYINEIYKSNSNPKEYLLNDTIDFHWADWLDLSQAEPFIKLYPKLLKRLDESEDAVYIYHQTMCQQILTDHKPHYGHYDLDGFVHERTLGIEICGAIEKYLYAPIPERILLETDYHYHQVGVNPQRLKSPLGIEGLVKRYHNLEDIDVRQFGTFDPNSVTQLTDEIKQSYIDKGYEMQNFKLTKYVDLDVSAFTEPDVNAEIETLEEKGKKLTTEEEKRLDFFIYSDDNIDKKQPIFFTSVQIGIDSKDVILHHYSYPWMRKILSAEERLKIIHHTIRSWFKFAEMAQVICWFSYGNLYGWYFNSQNLPWDNDLDVQISIQDQDKLGKYYNNTLVIENPELGDHIFFYQTNPWYLQPHQGQHIDSRYIEARSGIYIDISALWLDKSIEEYEREEIGNREKAKHSKNKDKAKQPGKAIKKIHCKNNNNFPLEDIFSLRRTVFEGAQCYIPFRPKKVLWDFYGEHCTDKLYNKDHNWQKDIGMWIQNQICEKDLIPGINERFDNNGDLTLYGACNDSEILRNFKLTREQYEIHEKEFDIVVDKNWDASELSEDDLPIYRFYDPTEFQ